MGIQHALVPRIEIRLLFLPHGLSLDFGRSFKSDRFKPSGLDLGSLRPHEGASISVPPLGIGLERAAAKLLRHGAYLHPSVLTVKLTDTPLID